MLRDAQGVINSGIGATDGSIAMETDSSVS